MQIIQDKRFDREWALYGSDGVTLKHCSFDGPADGESALKECKNATAEDCFFNLRYPFWHDDHLRITGSEMTELCRGSAVVFGKCGDPEYKTSRDQGTAGMQSGKDERL